MTQPAMRIPGCIWWRRLAEVRVNFLNWRPDQDEFNTDGLQVADNVLHDVEGYKETRALNTGSTLNNTTLTAAFLAVNPLGDGTTDHLGILHDTGGTNRVYLGTFGTWSEYQALPPAGATAGSLTAFSSTELNDKIVACAKFNFATTLPTGTTTASGYISYNLNYGNGSTWTDLPEDGIVCGRINRFAMIGNIGSGSPGNLRVRWCAINDATSWPTPNTDAARAVQAGEQVLDGEFGEVTAISDGDFFGYVFQTKAITKFTYVGGDIVFQVDTFEEVRGCGYYDRIVAVDDKVFYESTWGRHVVENGVITNIGEGWVDDSYPPDTRTEVRIHANPAISTVFFTNGVAYNYQTGQWTRPDDLTPILSINSPTGIIGQWIVSGGQTLLVDSTGGAKLGATITTGDADLTQGETTYVGGVRPLVDGGTWSVRVGSRPNLSTTISWSTATSVTERTGLHDFREEGRYQRVELTNSDGFNTLMGADIDAEPAGKV